MKKIRLDIEYPARFFILPDQQTLPAQLDEKARERIAEDREKLGKDLSDLKAHPQQFSYNILTLAVGLVYKQFGQSDDKQPGLKQKTWTMDGFRMWGKIQNKLIGDNGKAVKGELEISDEWFTFMLDTISLKDTEGVMYPQDLAGPVEILLDYLETVKLEKKEDTK